MIIAGDFNRHDQLWGGNKVSIQRQGEADPIIDFMATYSLQSLLPRGTITWESAEWESTIDLILVPTELANTMLKCDIHDIEHGSDHKAIESSFDIAPPEQVFVPRYLFKNAPWQAIRNRIRSELREAPSKGTVQELTDELIGAVERIIFQLTPLAKPSPYAKRWWTEDLTQLWKIYTHWRNRARAER